MTFSTWFHATGCDQIEGFKNKYVKSKLTLFTGAMHINANAI